MPVTGTTVVRRQLGRRLRRLRDAAGKTVADVEAARLVSAAKLWRIETGKTPVKIADVRGLCWLYGADEQTADTLSALALGTEGQGWWEDYSDVMEAGIALFIGLEEVADEIRTYEAELVPGLFQTADYTRAVNRAERPDWAESAIDRRVALRQERQRKVLGRNGSSPQIAAVLNAAVLSRQVGGPEVMTAQVGRLHELAALDHIDIRVLPWDAGAHAAMAGSFTILEFANPDDPAVAHADSYVGARYVEDPKQVDEYRTVFGLVRKHAVALEEYDTS